jgi:fumarylpyruvate hydrolase
VSAAVQRVLPAIPAIEVPVVGGGFFPVRRVYCVGRNMSTTFAR